MAKKLKDMRGENAVAAGQIIGDSATKIGQQVGILTGRLETLAENLAESDAALESERAAHASTASKAARSYDKLKEAHDALAADHAGLKASLRARLDQPLRSTGKSVLPED